ncbi:MAG: response regulator [Desulfobacterales bacterium]|nr:response regulator [Desulfobacterales bacterium]
MAFDKQDAGILVVDDDKALADSLVEYLSDLGYSAQAAYSGREGLDRFENGTFHLVITDIKMPGMDGMELLEAVKAHDKQVMVMLVTGYGTIESAVEAMKKGAYDYTTKPVKMEELEIIVSRALQRYVMSERLSVLRGLTMAMAISAPLWLIVGIALALLWRR